MRRFCITDDWTQTSDAHRLLDEPCIGTTTFQEFADYMMESEDSTTTANDEDSTRQVAGRHRAQPNRNDDDSMGQPGAQRSEPTTAGAMTAATIFIVDGQPGARRCEPTAIRGHGRQTPTKKDIEPSLDVLRSSLDESHGVSEEVEGCSRGTTTCAQTDADRATSGMPF